MMKWNLHQAARPEFWAKDQFLGLDSLAHRCEHTFSTPSLSFPSCQKMRIVLAPRRHWDVKSQRPGKCTENMGALHMRQASCLPLSSMRSALNTAPRPFFNLPTFADDNLLHPFASETPLWHLLVPQYLKHGNSGIQSKAAWP